MWVRHLATSYGTVMKQLFPHLIHSKKILAKRGSYEGALDWWRKVGYCFGVVLASGVTLPSYIVHRCKYFYNTISLYYHTWCQSEPAGALYWANGSAWMEQGNFLSWSVKIQFLDVKFIWSLLKSMLYLRVRLLTVKVSKYLVLTFSQ